MIIEKNLIRVLHNIAVNVEHELLWFATKWQYRLNRGQRSSTVKELKDDLTYCPAAFLQTRQRGCYTTLTHDQRDGRGMLSPVATVIAGHFKTSTETQFIIIIIIINWFIKRHKAVTSQALD